MRRKLWYFHPAFVLYLTIMTSILSLMCFSSMGFKTTIRSLSVRYYKVYDKETLWIHITEWNNRFKYLKIQTQSCLSLWQFDLRSESHFSLVSKYLYSMEISQAGGFRSSNIPYNSENKAIKRWMSRSLKILD
jgi:hypothetical protein